MKFLRSSNIKRFIPLLILILFSNNFVLAQRSSRNGSFLPVKVKIHALMLFIEYNYMDSTHLDPTSYSSTFFWPVNGLPNWKDNMYDTGLVAVPYGEIIIKV